MSKNYYMHPEGSGDPCEHCGYVRGRVHIGKASVGWAFLLHVTDELPDLPEWIAAWSRPGWEIVDEYGWVYTPAEMEAKVREGLPARRGAWFPLNPEWVDRAGRARWTVESCYDGRTYDRRRGVFS